MRNNQEVNYEFTPAGKLDQGGQQRLLNIEVAFKDLGHTVIEMTPETPARTIALNHLLMAKMMCSQAISHPGVAPAQQPISIEEKKEVAHEQKSRKKA